MLDNSPGNLPIFGSFSGFEYQSHECVVACFGQKSFTKHKIPKTEVIREI